MTATTVASAAQRGTELAAGERVEAPWKDERLEDAHPVTKPDHTTVMPDKGEADTARRAVLGIGPVKQPETVQCPDTESPPSRGALLREAEGLITGDRNKSYGSPTQNFTNIADLWNVQFRHKLVEGQRFTATDVAIAMIHVKQARLIAQPKRDNFVDIAGYAACGWEAQEDTLADIAALKALVRQTQDEVSGNV